MAVKSVTYTYCIGDEGVTQYAREEGGTYVTVGGAIVAPEGWRVTAVVAGYGWLGMTEAAEFYSGAPSDFRGDNWLAGVSVEFPTFTYPIANGIPVAQIIVMVTDSQEERYDGLPGANVHL
jgi:hypothetical protein